MSNNLSTSHVRYVIVVHGIGDQRKNETVLDVINRFCEVRSNARETQKGDPLTLGTLSSQTTNINPLTGEPWPWIEFEKIPCVSSPPGAKMPPWLPRRVTNTDGDNIRFVDVHWADIMRGQFCNVGEDVDTWSSSLVDRFSKNPDGPAWALDLLTIMREAVVLVQKAMALKLPGLATKVFNDFLGDVQLYGEYGPCRAQGVRRFHDLMEKIQTAHDLEQEQRKNAGAGPKDARYTIIAHSLGTIMSLDALLYACADLQRSGNKGPWFAGYLVEKDKESRDPLDSAKSWINNVDALVTLGSPIDKYLVVWWLNYEHLNDDSWVVMPKRNGHDHKIRHFNYSDEQDPVGGELDVAYTKPAIKKLFEHDEDLVFTRYAVPGAAHVGYWKDLDLFKDIIHRAVDNVAQKTPRLPSLKPFLTKRYLRALSITYGVIPVVFWAVLGFSLTLAVSAKSAHTAAVAVAVFFATLYLARRVFHFVIEGRQVILSKLKRDKRLARKCATFILPVAYLILLFFLARGAIYLWPFGVDFLSCVQNDGWEACENAGLVSFKFKDFVEFGLSGLNLFVWDILGVLVVGYGLCAYIWYKMQRNLEREPEAKVTPATKRATAAATEKA